MRFAWWTDEEQGLNGSEFYVNSLSTANRSAIKGYYNFDMIGSTNGGYFVNNITTAVAAPMKEYWDSLGLSRRRITKARAARTTRRSAQPQRDGTQPRRRWHRLHPLEDRGHPVVSR